ncbi:hypothetical protein VTI74DRAFT_2317 [Chaetomium olivicolor]
MARSTLVTVPVIVFGVIEPILFTWAYTLGMLDPAAYFTNQVPATAATFSPHAESATLQLVNVLLLLAAMAVVCCFSHDPATAKWGVCVIAVMKVLRWATMVGVFGPIRVKEGGEWKRV